MVVWIFSPAASDFVSDWTRQGVLGSAEVVVAAIFVGCLMGQEGFGVEA